ncbi:MAG: TIR domain-containing protein [Nitrososphaeraceae archaeon]|nr:TIR domain-containing protein [Nitrososphaeraceae archaeon]
MNTRKKVFVSYASTDSEIARRIVDCLKESYPELWFAEYVIVGGDNVILDINAGLVDSLMGIPILSNNFFETND